MPTTTTPDLDRVRARVLDRMERSARHVRLALFGAATLEMLFFVLAALYLDWHSRLERLLFAFSVLTYTILVLGLVALGAHVSRSVARVLVALERDGAG